MGLFQELKRRNVFRVGIAYAVTSWLVLQVADIMFELLGAPDWSMRMVAGILVLGLPIALIFAWAFELTPEGVKREREVDRSQSITHSTGRKLDFFIIGVLVIALGYFVIDKYRGPSDSPPDTADQGQSIAVLPFVNMSQDDENEYFSDGIAEEVLNLLVQVDGLKVAARTASFQFRGHTGDVSDIAEQLNVATVLEGSVRRFEDRVRITAQLISAADGFHMWSATYDRELEDIFAVQDDIANNIAAALLEELGTAPVIAREAPTENTAAHDLYLRALHVLHQRGSSADIEAAIGFLKGALDLDPEFTEARVWLGASYAVLPSWLPEPDPEYWDLARVEANAVLEVDPDNYLAHATLGLLSRTYPDYVNAVRHGRRSVEINPQDPVPHFWLGITLQSIGFVEESLEAFETAHRLDTSFPLVAWWLGVSYTYTGEWDRAIETLEKALDLGSSQAGAFLGLIYAVEGEAQLARIAYTRSGNPQFGPMEWYPRIIEALASGEDASELREELIAYVEDWPRSRFLIGWHLAVLGDQEAGMLMAISVADRDPIFFAFTWVPWLAEARQLPAYKDAVRKFGLLDYWNAQGFPPQCRPVGNDDFECD